MIPDEVRPIVVRLLEKSRDREVNWLPSSDVGIPTAEGETDFTVTLPDYSINIWRQRELPTIPLAMYDSQGRTVYKVSCSAPDEDYPLMEELLELARRKALNVEAALAALRSILDAPGVLGGVKETAQASRGDDIPF